MYRFFLALAGFLCMTSGYAQNRKAQDFGFRHLNLVYEQDPVNVLILSQKGEEQKPKPLFLFIQDDLPIPLIIYDEQGAFGTFPFETDELLQHYHLAIVGKPFIPVVAQPAQLQDDFTYLDPQTDDFPREFLERNRPDYYTGRNLAVLRQLKTKAWVQTYPLVVAGHGEGSTIAARMAAASDDISHVIYSGGNPLAAGSASAPLSEAAPDTAYGLQMAYERLSNLPADSLAAAEADSVRPLQPEPGLRPKHFLEQIKAPVLVVWGSEDAIAPFNELLQQDIKQQNKGNFTFLVFDGLTHNYFGLTEEGETDYDTYHWDRIAESWLDWLKPSPKK
jgi:dienelactone hydrolase